MYALLFPSAHLFISATEANVNVALWHTSVTTGPLTPCRFGSPACTAIVCNPSRVPSSVRNLPPRRFLTLRRVRVFFIVRRLFALHLRSSNHQFGVRFLPAPLRTLCLGVILMFSHWSSSHLYQNCPSITLTASTVVLY